jgi:hypothetical protein
LAIIDLIELASGCIDVRYSTVWLLLFVARPTAASSSGRLVSAARQAKIRTCTPAEIGRIASRLFARADAG